MVTITIIRFAMGLNLLFKIAEIIIKVTVNIQKMFMFNAHIDLE